MQARPVDPRDTRWERNQPVYRVHFWQGQVSSEWEVDRADVDEVLDWAQEHALGRSFVLYARIVDGEGPGLIRLLGTDPLHG